MSSVEPPSDPAYPHPGGMTVATPVGPGTIVVLDGGTRPLSPGSVIPLGLGLLGVVYAATGLTSGGFAARVAVGGFSGVILLFSVLAVVARFRGRTRVRIAVGRDGIAAYLAGPQPPVVVHWADLEFVGLRRAGLQAQWDPALGQPRPRLVAPRDLLTIRVTSQARMRASIGPFLDAEIDVGRGPAGEELRAALRRSVPPDRLRLVG